AGRPPRRTTGIAALARGSMKPAKVWTPELCGWVRSSGDQESRTSARPPQKELTTMESTVSQMAAAHPVLRALGDRMKEARLALGLSQETLAAPEFTKSYISAIERGRARPSL